MLQVLEGRLFWRNGDLVQGLCLPDQVDKKVEVCLQFSDVIAFSCPLGRRRRGLPRQSCVSYVPSHKSNCFGCHTSKIADGIRKAPIVQRKGAEIMNVAQCDNVNTASPRWVRDNQFQ